MDNKPALFFHPFFLLLFLLLLFHQSSSNSVSSPSNSSTSVPPSSTDSAPPPTQSQLIRPPSSADQKPKEEEAHNHQNDSDHHNGNVPTVKVARQSPSAPPPSPFGALKPESKDEMFARIDDDRDSEITLDDYMKRDRFYVESVRSEFNDIDTNHDGRVTKAEFDAFVNRLDEQRKAAMLEASKFTLQKNDLNKDGQLSIEELGAYINGTLQRNMAQLPTVFRQHDRDGNQKLNLDEFHELDFSFPWEKFPPSDAAQHRPMVPFTGGAQPPPFMAEQSAPLPVGAPFPAGGRLPQPQPVFRR